jgi:hypothetical protein
MWIAMAGTHQIWGLFLEDTIWWKYKNNGHEENAITRISNNLPVY